MKILKFGALWCRECLVMKSIWEEIEDEIPALATNYYDIDEDAEIAKKYKVKYVPVSIFLDKKGREIFRLPGTKSKENLIKIVKANLNK
jgi:thioredoxin 1